MILMSWHLKAIGYKVYLAVTKESYLSDSRHIEANALALKALRTSLDKEYLHVFSHYAVSYTHLTLPTIYSV